MAKHKHAPDKNNMPVKNKTKLNNPVKTTRGVQRKPHRANRKWDANTQKRNMELCRSASKLI